MAAKNKKNENNTFTDRPHCNEDGHPISKECIGYDDITNIKHKKRIKRKNAMRIYVRLPDWILLPIFWYVLLKEKIMMR